MAKIIVVEDEADLREEISHVLRRADHIVAAVGSSAELYRELVQDQPDLVILDVRLPGEDGLSIARQLRAMTRTRAIGIIMLTGEVGEARRIQGLDAGADAYIEKPMRAAELRAQVASLCRRLQLDTAAAPPSWKYQRLSRTLVAPNGYEVSLTHMESALIELLAKHAGQPVRRADIVRQAFGQDPLQYDERRLEAIVSRVRRKLQRAYPLAQPLKVVHAVGYTFSAVVDVQ